MTQGKPASFHEGRCHFCSETCITDCVVLSDSIGFPEWGRKRERGEKSETANDRQMAR